MARFHWLKYPSPALGRGEWSDFMFVHAGERHAQHCALCPATAALLTGGPLRQDCASMTRGSCFFSRMKPGTWRATTTAPADTRTLRRPLHYDYGHFHSTTNTTDSLTNLNLSGTHLKAHVGPTNVRLRVHLGIDIPSSGWRIRVGDETRTWEQGKCLVFDDSFVHEVWHDGDPNEPPRVVLICDVWHPAIPPTKRGRIVNQGAEKQKYDLIAHTAKPIPAMVKRALSDGTTVEVRRDVED